MDEKIYKLVMLRRKTRMYFDLPEAARSQLHAQIEQIRADVGAKLASGVFDCMWSNEQVSEFYIVEYPNIGAVFEEMDCLEKIHHPWYFHATYLLGKASPWADFTAKPREPVSKLVLISDEEDGYNRLAEETKQHIWEQVFENIKKVGAGTEQLWFNCLATSGKYNGFGIMHYPDVQALVEEVRLSQSQGLLAYWHTEIVVGVRAE